MNSDAPGDIDTSVDCDVVPTAELSPDSRLVAATDLLLPEHGSPVVRTRLVLVITAISRCRLSAILFSIDKEAELLGNFVPRSPAMSPNNRHRSTPILAAVNTESKRSLLLGYK